MGSWDIKYTSALAKQEHKVAHKTYKQRRCKHVSNVFMIHTFRPVMITTLVGRYIVSEIIVINDIIVIQRSF